MMELIDKNALIEDVMNDPIEIPILEGDTVVGVRRIRGEYLEQRINEQPTIDAMPVIYAEWEIRTTETVKGDVTYIVHKYFCSECGKQAEHFFKYCPHCGVKMNV